MPRKTWKPSLEEAAVLCVIRAHREAACRAPLVAQVLTRWIAEGNWDALREAQRTLKPIPGEKRRGRGRPPKASQYSPEFIAASRAIFIRFFQLLPSASRREFLKLRPSTAKLTEKVLPQSVNQVADAILQGLLGMRSRTLKGRLAEGNKELLRPKGLDDLARTAGIQPEAWKPVWDYLMSLPQGDRMHTLWQLLPPDTLSTT